MKINYFVWNLFFDGDRQKRTLNKIIRQTKNDLKQKKIQRKKSNI